VSKEFRVKGTRLALDVLDYLRVFLLMHYTGKDANRILVTVPVSLDFELFMLQFALRLYNYLLSRFKTSPSNDSKLLESNEIPAELRFAVELSDMIISRPS
jgi:hypothetical protein